jgi:hypothetical protein
MRVLIVITDRFLRSADQTIVLNKEGRVVELGGYESLKSFAGNERKLETGHLCQEEASATTGRVGTGRNGPNQAELPSKPTDTTDLASRSAGDFSTYAYYFRSIGWLPAIFFISYTAIRATFALFPRKLLIPKSHSRSRILESGY